MDSRVGTTFGKYTISRLIGRGGMGEVYEAYDTEKERTVALKILADEYTSDPGFRTRFQRESHAAAVLQEPHVIPIHDWGEIDGHLYIDMRLVAGHTLADLLAAGPLTPSRAANIVAQVSEALDAAHAQGLVHRDIKPQNIIVTPTDFAYLVDFGIAETAGDSGLTSPGTKVGTLNYMAPERFSDAKATAAIDVYALAGVLYEALTGETPYAADGLEHLIAAHVTLPPPRPSEANPRVPAAFDDVVARGMAKDPDDRYGTAGGLGRAALRALAGGQPTAVTTVPTPTAQHHDPTQSAPNRRRWLMPTALAMSALALVAVGVLIWLLVQRDSDSGRPDADGPPLVTGPDQSKLHQTCDEGFALPTREGFGTRAGRGTPETSCFFTDSVLRAYWDRYGNASPLPRDVSAPGAVDCAVVRYAECDGADFLMHCQQYTGDNWITCTGGQSARVFLW
ncbi:serine/threonine-protein kinase [Mycolicibacterium sp. 120270]|uniref:serine/threonine-protein kinase n=1 Tax=Mycolicibacterium sp. 120270 TaxID=3090600 RepID=UPI00299D9091|nr:serine/threonine-protein kinase [Mycolicibacterium sp. 120270]MDX1885784.1 serine/threonine-protein kinase [Mycolicibacterium sp. 120270]